MLLCLFASSPVKLSIQERLNETHVYKINKTKNSCSCQGSVVAVTNVINVYVTVMYVITIVGILYIHLLAFSFQDIAFRLFVDPVKVLRHHESKKRIDG